MLMLLTSVKKIINFPYGCLIYNGLLGHLRPNGTFFDSGFIVIQAHSLILRRT